MSIIRKRIYQLEVELKTHRPFRMIAIDLLNTYLTQLKTLCIAVEPYFLQFSSARSETDCLHDLCVAFLR